MNRIDAKELLELLDIPSVHYSIDSVGIGENWALFGDGNGAWIVCYFERGKPLQSKTFGNETDAAAHFIAEVLSSDPRLSERLANLRTRLTR